MGVSLCKVRLCSVYYPEHGLKSVSSVREKSNPEAVGTKLKMWDFPPKKCPIVCCFILGCARLSSCSPVIFVL